MSIPTDEQEVFDRVARHLLTQRRKSMIERSAGPVCAFRGVDGTKCAIGCLIPDQYDLDKSAVLEACE